MSSEVPENPEKDELNSLNHNGTNSYSNETEFTRAEYFRVYDVRNRLIRDGVDVSSVEYAQRAESQLFEDMSSLIGDAMSSLGINLQDPLKANMFHYNKTHREFYAEPSQYGKTYVFFTRPDLNLCKANIDSFSSFKYLFSTQLGKELMAMLTGPDRAVYGNITGYTRKEMEEESIDLAEYNPIAAVNAAKNLVTSPITGLHKLYQKNFAEKVNFFINNQVMGLYREAHKKGKEGLEALADLGNQLIDQIDSKTGNILSNTKNIFTELGSKVKEGNSDMPEEGQLIENSDPELKVKTEDDSEFLAKKIPQFFNTKERTYGNTKRIPRTKSNEYLQFTSPFIPMLSNNCTSVPAGKDIMLESYEYAEDFRGHRLTVATGADSFNSSGELTINFKDTLHNPVWRLFYIWIHYIWKVNNGEMIPRWGDIVNRILDYTCSIYVFCLDKDGQTIKFWVKYTGCYPKSLPLNMIYHQTGQLDNDALTNLSITFAYNFMDIMNPEIFTDFNLLSESEWRRKMAKDHQFFAIENTNEVLTGNIDPECIWQYIDHTKEAGLSGKVPIKSLPGRFDTTHLKHYSSWLAREKNSAEYEYSDHWGGYPYIINGGRHFVWINPSLALRRLDDKTNKKIKGTQEKTDYLPNETDLLIV